MTARAAYFNPLSPHGERHRPLWTRWRPPPWISIHSPHTGRDEIGLWGPAELDHFNPLSPHGERHGGAVQLLRRPRFQSTLPTRGETPCTYLTNAGAFNFNPLSPHGERHKMCQFKSALVLFQSTLPTRGETPPDGYYVAFSGGFQSTLPTRGETLRPEGLYVPHGISIHSPHTGRDRFRSSRERP